VLSGIAGALLAQGCEPGLALRAAVRLHGLAGDAAAARHGGVVGISATDVALLARDVANRFATPGRLVSATPHP
jgi:NAD(P)H-hydrate repair Nnr-like enzyme with NAD(P)H-hydrate dehydratase domain